MTIPSKTNLLVTKTVRAITVDFVDVSADPFDYCYVPIGHEGGARIMNRKYELKAEDVDDEGGFDVAFRNHVEQCFSFDLERRDSAKKLMLLGGIRYLLPVIETAHKMGVHVITADYLTDNIAHNYVV